MRTIGNITVTTHDDGSTTIIMQTNFGATAKEHLPAGEKVIITANAVVTRGRAWSHKGFAFRTTSGLPTNAWDDGEYLYINTRGRQINRYSLNTGKKMQY